MTDQLKSELTAIMGTIQERAQTKWQSPEEVTDYGRELTGWMSRSGEIQSQAKRLLHKAKAAKALTVFASMQSEKKIMSPLVMKQYIDDACEKENELYELAERTCRCCSHTLDFLRSVLSTMKAEMMSSNSNFTA